MGEAFGDPEEFELAGCIEGFEMEAGVFAEVWGVAAKIDSDVPDMASEDADELSLWFAELVMESAEDATRGEGLVVLDEHFGEACGGEGSGVEDFGEPSAVVSEALWREQLDIAKRGV